ncbi:uncharacterized protein E0L32_011677 [Thyridium curvatum]|uniref:Dienelactone hydrolase domain-containing protein n=1 Tax=Thyridium curvatum TaxID=1093900 RepID=A0A507BGF2_9PEZI|nr:uncharacterized protein E0L32_011677 [Thyridium curvatum]TPX18436.1 hypothetical protein E0L32_011677 [Thyridium curvatum]
MADPEVATKAPESDAAEATQPATSSDTPAQTNPTMGEHCTSDRPTPTGQSSTGEITQLGGVDVYISKPSEYPHAPARLLLLLTGGTGVKSVNNQIQADKFASEGFVVVMPDLFGGDAAPNASTTSEGEDAEPASPSLLEQFKLKAAEAAKSFLIDMWLARHTQEKVMPILHKVIDACKEEFADAVSNGDGIYAVGYCFGGRYILLLASEKEQEQGWAQPQPDEEAGTIRKGPFIKVGALAHATLVSPDDFEGLKAPINMVCVENDPLFPDEVRKAGEDYLSKNNVDHQVKVYPHVPHGFAVVGEYEDAAIRAAQATAFDQMLQWLKDH